MNADKQQSFDWTQTLDDIENNSPYTYTISDDGVELLFIGNDEVPSGVIGTIHSPADWNRIKLDVERFGVWPAGISF